MDKIYYHGSNSKFTTFDKSKIRKNKLGLCFNFTDDYSIAYLYGDNILKVHLDLNNPLTKEIFNTKWTYEQDEMLAKKLGFPGLDKKDFDDTETFGEVYEIFKMDPRFIELLEEMGYDGISFPEEHHFGVFEPEQIHVINDVKESLEKIDNFYLTQNAYDVIRFIKGRKQDTRIVYDSNINYYFFSLALDYTHIQLLEQARKTGLYTVKDMTDYFIENEDSVYFLYYYPTVAEVTTNKGFVSEQYPNEYKYDFGTICSYYTTNFEEMELYNLLKKDLNEQLAYHGSREKFDKFDLNKFQRGDYGYGIYFTKSKSYAGDYGDVRQYEIPDNEYLLDWESTWQYQSEYVYDCLDKLFDNLYDNDRDNWEKIMEIVDRGYGNDGEGLYMNLSEILNLTSKQTSELLYKYGIKGIDSFKGNCQVIFNPEDVKILEPSLNEKLEKIGNIEYLYNPTKSELQGLSNKSGDEIRGILMTDTDEIYIWNAYNYTHSYIDSKLGLRGPRIEFRIKNNYIFGNGPDGLLCKEFIEIIKKSRLNNLGLNIFNPLQYEDFKSLNEKLEKYL